MRISAYWVVERENAGELTKAVREAIDVHGWQPFGQLVVTYNGGSPTLYIQVLVQFEGQ